MGHQDDKEEKVRELINIQRGLHLQTNGGNIIRAFQDDRYKG